MRTLLAVAALTLPCAMASSASPSATEVQLLSGTGPDDGVDWEFFCTAGRRSRVWTTLPVPSLWEQHGFGSYDYGGDILAAGHPLAMEQGLYRHRFFAPTRWRGRVVRLVFDGSMTDTEVWVNGRSAGPVHRGGFYRFRFDVTDLLRLGQENLLEVTVAKVSANPSVNAAERAADYWVFGGIYRPVWLEVHPRHFVDWTAIDARADGHFRAEVHMGSSPPGGRVEVRLVDPEGRRLLGPLTAAVTDDGTRAVVTGDFEDVKTWTAETPHVYRAEIALRGTGPREDPETAGEDADVWHRVVEPFGFRTVEVRPGDGVYVNGRKIRLKGINRHCFWPETGRAVSREQSYADARLIKEANLNAVRMSHYPPDVHFLEAADTLGLYVLDELAGWQAAYDTPTGQRLIGQMVRRDVNHPSILFWDNGNEGGWNTENDDEFARWDPQGRTVLHPWESFGGIDTDHYEGWDSHLRKCAGPEIYMPTELLHGLYDGGIGAGLHDYWSAMKASPTVAGSFFWVFADEGVARTDRDGRIDNAGNRAADGMLGPHREKEGSFFTVKEIASPVQVVAPEVLPAGWDGTLEVENAYDFTSLERCRFRWRTVRFPSPEDGRAGHTTLAEGDVPGPKVAPGSKGTLTLALPEGWSSADALHLAAFDPDERELWTWSWPLAEPSREAERPREPLGAAPAVVSKVSDGSDLVAEVGELALRFDRATGRLRGVRVGEREIALSGGPRLLAWRRDGRRFEEVGVESPLVDLTASATPEGAVVTATFEGALREARWTIAAGGTVELEYAYRFHGAVDVLGVGFDYPEERVKAKRWLGRGPYRVYRNRLEGGVLDVWETAYNDPVPGETYAYPGFKGYFTDWGWLTLETTDGDLTIENLSSVPFFGLYRPRMGRDGLLDLPDVGLALLEVVPAQRTKFLSPERLGPQSATPLVGGEKRGRVAFRFSTAD